MKLEMAKNSIFAILLRSPWWISLVAAGAIFAGLRLALPELYAFFFTIPFLVIGAYTGWAQLRAPSAATVGKKIEALRALDADQFADAIENAFRREGYAVTRLARGEVDLELSKEGRRVLVACKRWKATRTGIEPLRQLHAAGKKRDAAQCIYVTAGEITQAARDFAAQSNIRLFLGEELARLRP